MELAEEALQKCESQSTKEEFKQLKPFWNERDFYWSQSTKEEFKPNHSISKLKPFWKSQSTKEEFKLANNKKMPIIKMVASQSTKEEFKLRQLDFA